MHIQDHWADDQADHADGGNENGNGDSDESDANEPNSD